MSDTNVICQFWDCGKQLRSITNTHLRQHGITQQEYNLLFPDSPLHSKQTNNLRSKALEGRIFSPEHKAKISVAKTGQYQSEATKQKLRVLYEGKTLEEIHGVEKAKEIKSKIKFSTTGDKNHFFGKNHKPESKKLMGRNMKGENNPCSGRQMPEEQKKRTGDNHKESGRYKGKNNPNWNGGTSFEPYDVAFNQERRREVKEMYNHVCQHCGVLTDSKNSSLRPAVHHINYNKKYSEIPNLILLCHTCHNKTNPVANRDYSFAYCCWLKGVEPESLAQ